MELMNVGENIRKKRLAKSWKQATLAEKVDLSNSYMGMI